MCIQARVFCSLSAVPPRFAVGVLYATLLALTLQVLYQRLTRIEENVTTEAMLLSQVTRNLLSLFADEPEWAVEACQVVANQLRIMLSRTRGVELLSISECPHLSVRPSPLVPCFSRAA